MKMRVLYDGQIYSMQVAGGINRYFANLISRLPSSFAPSLLVEKTREVNYPAHPNLKVYECGKSRSEHISYRLSTYRSRLETTYWRNVTAFRHFDIAHPTYYTLLTRQDINSYRCPIVLTVWDMIHELFPAKMDPTGEHAEMKRKAILSAQAIICISENTRKDLLERYSLPESKVRVAHLASEVDASLSHGPELVPSRPYYLYVGSRSSHKNFDGLLTAFARTISVQPDVALCVVGPPFNKPEGKLIAELKLGGYVEHYGHVGDSHLAKLYRCSVAFVYPSLYEGFGIPPLEAMSCGTIVVTSNSSSLPEVVGDAGIFFDPTSPDELTDILLSLLGNSAERERLIANGHRRSQEFSWEKTVSQTLDIYRSVSESRTHSYGKVPGGSIYKPIT